MKDMLRYPNERNDPYADPSIRENDVERFDAILHDPDSNHDDDLTGGDLAWSSFL